VNRFALTADIIEISPIRYTPSGLPVVECRLEHESQLEEAGVSRKVKLLLKAKAVGMLAERLAKLSMNQVLLFEGFLASGTHPKSVVFHIHSFKSVS